MASIEIAVVEEKSELKDFIDLPWDIYAEHPKWVPPLKKELRRLLDPRRHPFWASAERRLFLARRGSTPVGRIAGIIDRRYNELHDEKMGIWGFFECEDDPAAAAALFAAVETWVRQKGMSFLRGPLNPSTNYEVGLLIEGFEYPPALMMPYTPPYYPRLVEACGFTKEKDLVAFRIDDDYRLPEWMDRLGARIARKKGVSIRRFRPKDASAEFDLTREIYNASWAGNWGFVPLSNDEMRDIQRSVMTFVDPDLAFFITYEDDPAAVCVIFPDINPMLKRLNGRGGALGLLKMILHRREVTGLRCLIFGIKDRYRQLGLPLLAVRHIYEVVRQKGSYRFLELGWTLEDNEDVNGLLEEAGARLYKRYRIFSKVLLQR